MKRRIVIGIVLAVVLAAAGTAWAMRVSIGTSQSVRPSIGAAQATGAAPTPPVKANTPSPADTATGVAVTDNLTWVDGGGALTFDVYLDTVTPPVTCVSSAQAGASYDPYAPGCLAPSVTYYWRIDSTNATGTTTGDVWSFTTAAAGGGSGGASVFGSVVR
jgi:hypothetical protein